MRLKEARGRCFSAEAGLLHPQCRGPYTVSRVRVSPRAAAQLAAPACGVPLADPVCGQSSLSVPVLQLKLRRPHAVPASLQWSSTRFSKNFEKFSHQTRVRASVPCPAYGPRCLGGRTATGSGNPAHGTRARYPHPQTASGSRNRAPSPSRKPACEKKHRARTPTRSRPRAPASHAHHRDFSPACGSFPRVQSQALLLEGAAKARPRRGASSSRPASGFRS